MESKKLVTLDDKDIQSDIVNKTLIEIQHLKRKLEMRLKR